MRQIGLQPDVVEAADIDETPLPSETPRRLSLRLAAAKAAIAAGRYASAYVVAADTVVAVGRRILPKVEGAADGRVCLGLLSGRTHRVLTGVAVIGPDGRSGVRLVESRVTFKRLSPREIDEYLASGEGVGKAGGYAIQGLAGAYVTGLQGSYSGVVGLPLYETRNLLVGMGYAPP